MDKKVAYAKEALFLEHCCSIMVAPFKNKCIQKPDMYSRGYLYFLKHAYTFSMLSPICPDYKMVIFLFFCVPI